MISKKMNERLTRVGLGTPCGELLRRYWQPVCPVGELTPSTPKKRVRVMDENLVVYRDGKGELACIEEYCTHRRVSMYYGFVEDDGIRCCYHGWKFDREGKCVELPFETEKPAFMKKVAMKSYPVKALGGLIFIYMGPDPEKAPLLPRWDVLVREDGARTIRMFPVHECNWLQIQENTPDSTHTFYLHAGIANSLGLKHPFVPFYDRPIIDYGWEFCEWGIDKTLTYGGDVPEIEIRPPMIFPNLLRIPTGPLEVIQWRVPIDDERTQIVYIHFDPESNCGLRMAEDAEAPYEYVGPWKTPDGDYDLQSFMSHDQMAWENQGESPIYDRSTETLGASDKGIAMLREMLDKLISRVENGEEPDVARLTDPKKNQCISFEDVSSPVEGMDKIRAAAAE